MLSICNYLLRVLIYLQPLYVHYNFGQQFWSPKLSYRKIKIYYSDAEFNVEYDGTIRLHSNESIDGDIIV